MKISRQQQIEARKLLVGGLNPIDVAELMNVDAHSIYHIRTGLVKASVLEPLRKAAKKPSNKTHAGAVNYKFIMDEDSPKEDGDSQNKEVKVIKTWTFTMTELTNGDVKIDTSNNGFNHIELMGIASYTLKQIK